MTYRIVMMVSVRLCLIPLTTKMANNINNNSNSKIIINSQIISNSLKRIMIYKICE